MMEPTYIEMCDAWERMKGPKSTSDMLAVWGEGVKLGISDGTVAFEFTRETNPDGRYKIICNGKRVVEHGETKPL